jgi:uncharacterized iron-regulated membrane protein
MITQLQTFWHTPRQSTARHWAFYLHLYSGLIVGLLIFVVSLTGSIVVYKPEIERTLIRQISHVPPGSHPMSFQLLYDQVRASQPKSYKIINAYLYPRSDLAWSFRVQGPKGDGRVQVYIDQYRGTILGEDHFKGKATEWIYDLHVNLLSGKIGLLINGIGALVLTLLCLTGLVIWWPGRKRWQFGFRYEWRARWKRQNYDLHKLAGAFSLALIAVIAVSGAYFAFPRMIERPVEWVTGKPALRVPPRTQPVKAPKPNLDMVLATAERAMPGGETSLFTFPGKAGQPYSLRKYMPGDWRRTGDNLVYLDQYTGAVLRVDYHANLPWGIRFVRDVAPLHYGTFAGDWSRVLWLIIGLMPPLLFVSGSLMWWNRVLSKYWMRLRAGQAVFVPRPAAYPSTSGDRVRSSL